MTSPQHYGLPPRFTDFYDSQSQVISRATQSPKRFLIIDGPTGSGKTLVNMAIALHQKTRVLYLSGTTSLSKQLLRDFGSIGMVEIKGKSHYPCNCKHNRHTSPCRAYENCYYKARLRAKSARIVSTNYMYWGLAGPKAIGNFEVIIADEFHSLDDWLTKLGEVSTDNKYFQTTSNGNYVHSSSGNIAYPVLIKEQAKLVFRNARKIVLSSATVPDYLPALIGISTYDKFFLSSQFDFAKRRPIIYLKNRQTFKVSFQSTAEQTKKLADTCLNILNTVQGKGLIASHSYDLAAAITYRAMGRTNKQLIYHSHSQGMRDDALYRFRTSKDGFLLSPAVTTGEDFPLDQLRHIIIPQIPFPPLDDPLINARSKYFPSLYNSLTAQSLSQTIGRGMRLPNDWCMVWIIDGNWEWFCRVITWPDYISSSFEQVSSIVEGLRNYLPKE